MVRTRRYHPLAAEDLAAAARYYDDVSIDLGNRFRDSVSDRLESLAEYPESYACIHEQFRVAMTDHFPYVIIFEVRKDDVVVILGVFRAASDQAGWFERSL